MRFDPSVLQSAVDVERACLALLGDPLRARPSLGHVTAVWSPDGEQHEVMRVVGGGVRSAVDRFVLNLARARADAILTTGAVLRAEPGLRFVLEGPEAPAVMRWRIDVHHLLPPTALVLSGGLDLDLQHPALKGPAQVVLFVPEARADAVRRALRSFKWVKVHGDPEPTLEGAIAWLRSERDAHCISVEAGPSVASRLYDGTLRVDELLLSRYTGSVLDPALRAGSLPPRSAISTHLRCVHATPVDVEGWSFERWTAKET